MEDNTEPTVSSEGQSADEKMVQTTGPVHIGPENHHVGGVDRPFFKTHKGLAMLVVLLLIFAGGTVAMFTLNKQSDDEVTNSLADVTVDPEDEISSQQQESEPVSTIDYTSLPLGDAKYSSSPRNGFVYSCSTTFNGGGAFEQGPWINAEAGTWDLTSKISVDGNVEWPNAQWNANLENNTRVLTSANLPISHPTGTFPIAVNDEAYQYDRNPGTIQEQDLTLTVPLIPAELDEPQCIGGEVGVALTGVLIFSAFDAAGRDAVATEIQDSCGGHPQQGGFYHYHGYSPCFEDSSAEDEHSDLLGYAYDGFGIYGLKGEDGVELSSDDLDECHGHKHAVEWDEDEIDIYHYHFTQDFPYTVSCFKGQPLVQALSSGEGAGSMMGGQIPQEGGGGQGPIDSLPPPPGGGAPQ